MSKLGQFAAACVVVLCAFNANAVEQVAPGTGDDAAAINAAIATAAGDGGDGVVQLADGTYNLTAPVALNAAVELRGNDADRSQVILDGANAYRLIEVTKAGAFVHGIRFERGYSDKTDNYYHGPIYMTAAGVISNCTVKMSTPGKYCGGVGMNAGTIIDCDITGCNTADGYGASYGGALRLFGAACVADRLVITNNSAKTGAGVYLQTSGAKLINSLVAGNSAGTNPGAGVYAVSGTVVSNCVIRGNTGGTGGGIYGSCNVYDSLIVGNSGTTGGGFYKSGGTMRGCTVVGNTASVKGFGVYQSSGAIQDCILWHNGSSVYLDQEQSLAMDGGTCTYTCAARAGNGEGNVTDRMPAFVDWANGDYRLTAASPCCGSGKDGVDMGYYPFAAPTSPRASFSYVLADGKAPASTEFTAFVENATATSYVWNFGDGSAEVETTDATTSHTFAAAGRYSVTLTAKTAGGDLKYSVPNAVNLGSDVVYVSKTGSNTFPYDDWTTAANDVLTAIDAVICSDEKPGKVCLADDTYTIKSVIKLDKAVELVGNDADRSKVKLDAGNVNGVHLLYVRHPKAFAHGLRLQNSCSSKTDHGYDYYCGPVLITAGMVSNCTVKMSKNSKFCGGVGMSGGTIVDCDITGCGSDDGGAARIGGALRLYGATCVADRLVITNNTTKAGAGVYLQKSGAKLINSLVANNSAGTHSGGGIYAESGTVVSNCVIRGNTAGAGGGIYGPCSVYDSTIVSNTASSSAGGCVHQTGGTIARCVIAAGKANTYGGGVYKTSGTLDHVTVSQCNALTGGSGVYQTTAAGGAVKNSIVYENGILTGYSASDLVSTDGTVSYSCARELTDGTSGNTSKSPLFRNAGQLDLRLFSLSPCRGTAEDGTDMGAIPWEYDPDEPVEIVITVATDGSCYPVTATYACEITGQLPSPVTSYTWNFGDGTSDSATTNGIVHVYTKPGAYTATLTLDLENGQTRSATRKDPVTVYSDVAWVDVNNPNPEPPYDTEAKAANSFVDALNTVYVPDGGFGRVKVKAGRYTGGFNYTLKRRIHLESASGKRDVILDGQSKDGVLIAMENSGAVVSGFVVTNAFALGSRWGVFDVTSGTVTNCSAVHVSNGWGCYAGGAGARGENAKLLDCYFEDCKSTDSNGGGYHGMGGFLVRDGGLAENCFVTNCYGGSNVGGFQLVSGTVRNTTVVGCSGRGGVYQQDGLIENCRIIGNTGSAANYSAGVLVSGGTIRNCLVADNKSSTIPAGIRATGTAMVENCTIAGNSGTTAGIISGNDAKWINVLSWGNVGADSYGTATLDHCLVGVDPHFRNPARGDYRFRSGSPAQNSGTYQSWMDGAADLQGNPRILNGTVDIGCYEVPVTGLMLLVK